MKPKRRDGLTRLEVLIVVGVALIGGAVLLPMWIRGKEGAKKAICPSNLKEIWNAERNCRERGGCFPWQAPANRGGTLEFAETPDVFRHFQIISNEFQGPKVLVCPGDNHRTIAKSFGSHFSNANVSYFVGLDADEKHPLSMVHGDRNIIGGERTRYGAHFLQTNNVSWNTGLVHRVIGDVLLSDGSVCAVDSAGLRDLLAEATNNLSSDGIRLAIPRVPGE
jgi:hypothetical protein